VIQYWRFAIGADIDEAVDEERISEEAIREEFSRILEARCSCNPTALADFLQHLGRWRESCSQAGGME
jgi:hypothetical protein